LKRGEAGTDAVTQALGYAAEYQIAGPEYLSEMYFNYSHSVKKDGFVEQIASANEALQSINKHVIEGKEINESQILILLAEDFSPTTLAICDYLNGSSEKSIFTIECWKYSLFEFNPGQYHFVMQQILPAPSVRAQIEFKRQEYKANKYARDPIRVEFMREFMQFAWRQSVEVTRSSGQSYECKIKLKHWDKPHDLWFSIRTGHAHPRLWLPKDLDFEGRPEDYSLTKGKYFDNISDTLEFVDMDLNSAVFSEDFGKRVIEVANRLKEINAPDPANESQIPNTSGK